jgi:hypothetical protein
MNSLPSLRSMALRLAPCALALGLALSGCGTPGAPQPPSLALPARVADLSATRTGGQVTLSWTMPHRTTDKVSLRAPLVVRICRQEGAGACQPVAATPQFAPGAEASFTDTLPAEEAAGAPRPLVYFVELPNAHGRSAGLSNPASVVAGQAPAAVGGLRAAPHKEGIALAWQAATPEPAGTVVRLYRHQLTATKAADKEKEKLLATESEPADRSLLAADAAHPGRALDRSARQGESYEYRAQRVARVELAGKTLELAGPLSEPIRATAEDIFPPETPTGLAAVASLDEKGGAAIDLNWQSNTEATLAGYAVYRAQPDGSWRRISPAEPVPTPAFRDATVQPGQSYRYAVTALGRNGRESARSAEAAETVQQP